MGSERHVITEENGGTIFEVVRRSGSDSADEYIGAEHSQDGITIEVGPLHVGYSITLSHEEAADLASFIFAQLTGDQIRAAQVRRAKAGEQ